MIAVRTERFEGPMDLLLHLIEKNEIDIRDIPIALLAEQYLEQLDEMRATADMDSMSEFVLMAATLLEIKSKVLLPAAAKEGEEPEDPLADLARQIMEYGRYKAVADEFRKREGFSETVFFKPQDGTLPLAEITKRVVTPEEALGGVSAEKLFELFMDVMNRREEDAETARAAMGRIARETFTVAQAVLRLTELLGLYGEIGFYTAFSGAADKLEKIVTFLALLELIRARRCKVVQQEPFGPITIMAAQPPEDEAVEAWHEADGD